MLILYRPTQLALANKYINVQTRMRVHKSARCLAAGRQGAVLGDGQEMALWVQRGSHGGLLRLGEGLGSGAATTNRQGERKKKNKKTTRANTAGRGCVLTMSGVILLRSKLCQKESFQTARNLYDWLQSEGFKNSV